MWYILEINGMISCLLITLSIIIKDCCNTCTLDTCRSSVHVLRVTGNESCAIYIYTRKIILAGKILQDGVVDIPSDCGVVSLMYNRRYVAQNARRSLRL
jgi:hypothetical protein